MEKVSDSVLKNFGIKKSIGIGNGIGKTFWIRFCSDFEFRHTLLMHVLYFCKALGISTSKMMIPGVKYINVQNLISVLTIKSVVGWVFHFGWLVHSRLNTLRPSRGIRSPRCL